MLTTLHIENFALIDALHLELDHNLTIITGETGAGKSILLGALGLVLGNRADLTAVRDTSKKCIIEAHFNIEGLELESLFESNDLEFDNNTIIRREILPSGKSRAFINDSPVTLNNLASLGQSLIDIHSQHQTRSLSSEEYQLEVFDAFVNKQETTFASQLSVYQATRYDYKQSIKNRDLFIKNQHILMQEYDYNSFLLEELDAIPLDTLNVSDLEQESKQLSNVTVIQEQLAEVFNINTAEETGILDQLREVQRKLNSLSHLGTQYQLLHERVNAVMLEISDINQDIEHASDLLEANPERLLEVDFKIATLEKLFRKHNVVDIMELISLRDDLALKVLDTKDLEKKIEKLNTQINTLQEKLLIESTAISNLRKKYKPAFEKEILETIHALGMPNAQFEIKIESVEDFLDHGAETLEFLFTANQGTALLPLGKAASGGELSRVMLAIKALLVKVKKLPTILFDEIDTGVSGSIASKMAVIMKDMAHYMQVISITHLPQIAAAGDTHLVVEKKNIADRTVSGIQKLDRNMRVEELAKMLSAGAITDAARQNAVELLK